MHTKTMRLTNFALQLLFATDTVTCGEWTGALSGGEKFDMFSRLYTVPTFYRQTYGRTVRCIAVRAIHMRRSVKSHCLVSRLEQSTSSSS